MAFSLKSLFTRRRRMPVSFENRFRQFREVIAAHNEALEIMSDMGEKLGGEYLFDIVYVRESWAKLHTSLVRTRELFDVLSEGTYPELQGVEETIAREIQAVLDEKRPEVSQTVLPFREATLSMAHAVGRKCAALAEMQHTLGLNIPQGFCITTAAFDEIIEHNGLRQKMREAARSDELPDALREELREALRGAAIPPEVSARIREEVREITKRRPGILFAVRSSADAEDGESTFAGQFETVLSVPADEEAMLGAYRTVLASLFSREAAAYQFALGYRPGSVKMAVCCMEMVSPESSGVVYTSDPRNPRGNVLLISAGRGLGDTVVEGSASDLIVVERATGRILEAKKMDQETKTENTDPHNPDLSPVLSTSAVGSLAQMALKVERFFGSPQDIEWALDRTGALYLLQARGLQYEREVRIASPGPMPAEIHPASGTIVQGGSAAGRVFVVRRPEDLLNFPPGGVLVAGNDSSAFVRVMKDASAIITDHGSPASHMSALAREFRVPTVVNAGNATSVFKDGDAITVVIENDRVAFYPGILSDLAGSSRQDAMDGLLEYRKKRYLLRFVTPLHLVDPFKDAFQPETCRTVHDLLRFIHEKAVAELVRGARDKSLLEQHTPRKLLLSVPAGILVIDVGSGISSLAGSGDLHLEDLASAPLRSVLEGMLHPGLWQSEPVPLRTSDFLSSMIRMPDMTAESAAHGASSLAVVSAEYFNLSLRFGYHFAMVDCYCTEHSANNHVSFRFTGGATDLARRSLRVEFIAIILRELGFSVGTHGDLVTARISNLGEEAMHPLLGQLGRLLAYTRQLDAVLRSPAEARSKADAFIAGRYA